MIELIPTQNPIAGRNHCQGDAFQVVAAGTHHPLGSACLRRLPYYPGRAWVELDLGELAPDQAAHAVRGLLVVGFLEQGLEAFTAQIAAGEETLRQAFTGNGFYAVQGAPEPVWELDRATFLEQEARLIVHLTTSEAWEQARQSGEYRPDSLAAEGFIHLSRPEQVVQVGNSFYQETPDAILLWVDPQALDAELRWEDSDGQIFPHLYGPIPVRAVLAAPYLPRTPQGEYHAVPRA
jgi:uncharacterized protein (DUF952 family)